MISRDRVGPFRRRSVVWRPGRFYAAVVVAGVSIGAISLWMHEALPSPWDVGGNSIATWVIVPFFLGRRAGTRLHAAAAGVLSLCLLVISYYLTLLVSLGRGDFPATVAYWAVAAVVLGGPLGVLGHWSGAGTVWGRIACAVPGAVFLSEAWPGSAHFLFYEPGSNVVWGIWVAASLLVTLLFARGSCRSILVSLAALGPLTVASVIISHYAVTAFVYWTSTL